MVALPAAPTFLENELRSSLDTRYHWSASSQFYTPVAVLMQYMAEGWQLAPIVGSEKHCYGGGRYAMVYHFELIKGEQTLMMRVKGNPVVRRLLRHYHCQIVQQSGSSKADM